MRVEIAPTLIFNKAFLPRFHNSLMNACVTITHWLEQPNIRLYGYKN